MFIKILENNGNQIALVIDRKKVTVTYSFEHPEAGVISFELSYEDDANQTAIEKAEHAFNTTTYDVAVIMSKRVLEESGMSTVELFDT